MVYLDLLLGFLRVGCFSFGGAYGAIPLIRDVVLSYGWLTDEQLSYMIAVSESTPGPIMVNLATYVGSTQAGIPGSLLATAAVVLPSFIVIILLTALLKTFIKNKYIQAVLRGLKPCIIGIVLATGIYMTLKNALPGIASLFGSAGQTAAQGAFVDVKTLFLSIFLGLLMFGSKPVLKKKISPILLIVVAAVCGVIIF